MIKAGTGQCPKCHGFVVIEEVDCTEFMEMQARCLNCGFCESAGERKYGVPKHPAQGRISKYS